MSHFYLKPASHCSSLVQPRLLLEFVARNRLCCTYESYDWLGYFGWQLLFSTCFAFYCFVVAAVIVWLFAGVADVTNPSSVVNHLRLVPLVPISLEMIHFRDFYEIQSTWLRFEFLWMGAGEEMLSWKRAAREFLNVRLSYQHPFWLGQTRSWESNSIF